MKKPRNRRLLLHRETLRPLLGGVDLPETLTGCPNVTTLGTYNCATSGRIACNHLCPNPTL